MIHDLCAALAASMPDTEALTLGKQLNALLMAFGRIAETQQLYSAVKSK